MKKNIVAVIGLGRFGLSMVEELSNLGCQVLAMDKNAEHVAKAAEYATSAVICDSTDQEALVEAGIKEVDHVIIAFGSNMHDTVLTTVIVKEIGINNLTVRVDDEYFNNIILRLGATDIISPQKLAGKSLAMKVASTTIVDYYKLVGDYCTAQIVAKRSSSQSIVDMDLRNKYDVNILLISRNGKNIVAKGADIITEGDLITIFGTSKSIARFESAINGK
ncbi:MAG: TrkA family potassium uptake protein [Clostridia bacterium]